VSHGDRENRFARGKERIPEYPSAEQNAFRDPWSNFRYFLYLSSGAVFFASNYAPYILGTYSYILRPRWSCSLQLLRESSRSNLSAATIRQLTIRNWIRRKWIPRFDGYRGSFFLFFLFLTFRRALSLSVAANMQSCVIRLRKAGDFERSNEVVKLETAVVRHVMAAITPICS